MITSVPETSTNIYDAVYLLQIIQLLNKTHPYSIQPMSHTALSARILIFQDIIQYRSKGTMRTIHQFILFPIYSIQVHSLSINDVLGCFLHGSETA